jgi:hypothetical protein
MDESYLTYLEITTGGKLPAIMGYDFNGICPSQGGNNDAQKAIKWVKQRGGIVQFNWHWISPNADGDWSTKKFKLAQALADTNSESYKNMIRDMDLVAAQMKIMQDSGIAILWRPLHEAEGAWFWWGMAGGDACIKLYRLMYDRYVNHFKINNLIWVWNSYGTTKPNWYPGDDMVDIIAWDYPDYSATGSWSQYQQLFGDKGKLFGVGEDGTLTNPDLLETQSWLYFMTWAYMVKDPSSKDGKNPKDWLMQVYNDPRVITLDDLNPGPKARAGYSETVYDTDENNVETVSLDASLSIADNDSILTYKWYENDVEIASGIIAQIDLQLGTHKIKLEITTLSGLVKTSWVIKRVRRVNHAMNKTVKVSSTEGGYGNTPEKGVDGDLSTRWSSAYADPQWYQVDLEKPFDIQQVIINWENASAKAYSIQESNDGENWTTVISFTNMKTGARTDSIKNLPGGARYLRIYGTKRNTTYGYSFFEVEINGIENPDAQPVEETTPVETQPAGKSVKINPNSMKAGDKATVEVPLELIGQKATVFNPAGQMVDTFILNSQSAAYQTKNTMKSGIYLLKLGVGNNAQSAKFFIQ